MFLAFLVCLLANSGTIHQIRPWLLSFTFPIHHLVTILLYDTIQSTLLMQIHRNPTAVDLQSNFVMYSAHITQFQFYEVIWPNSEPYQVKSICIFPYKCRQLPFTAKKPMLNKSSPSGNTQKTRLQPKHLCLWNILHSYYNKQAKQPQILVLTRLHDISVNSVARTHYTIASAGSPISFTWNYTMGKQW